MESMGQDRVCHRRLCRRPAARSGIAIIRSGSTAADSARQTDRGAEEGGHRVPEGANDGGVRPVRPAQPQPATDDRRRTDGHLPAVWQHPAGPERVRHHPASAPLVPGARMVCPRRRRKDRRAPDDIIQAVAEGRRPEKMTDEQDIIYEFGQELNDLPRAIA